MRLRVLEWLTPATDVPGGRPPLLLLHGGMAHAGWWQPLAPLLEGFVRPFAFDRRGHGDSDWLDPTRYGWERDVADVRRVMRALDPGPWLIAGHSQGGLLAADLAARGDAPLAAIILLDVPLHPTGQRLKRAGDGFRKLPQLRYPSLDDAIRTFKPFPAPHRISPAVLQSIARESFKPTEDGGHTSKFHWQVFRADRDGTQRHPLADFADRLAGIRVPALCLRGAESTILSPEDHADMAARIPRASAVEIPDSTHNLHAEQPERIASAIRSFVASLQGRF